MDLDQYAVRPFGEADYEAEARLEGQNDPGFSHTAEEIRHWQEAEASARGHHCRKLVVEARRSGAVVAHGALAHISFDSHPQRL